MIIVLDVSGALEIIMNRDKASGYMTEMSKADWVIAPDLFYPEIADSLWKYLNAGLLSHEKCVHYVEEGVMMVDDFIASKDLWKEALVEGMRNNHPVYDMFYIILARRNDGKIISPDKKMCKLCKKMKIDYVE